MADKYINEVGLLAIRNWANGKFALDTELDALDARVDEIIAEGGEPNTIESISVNGTTVAPDAQKNVALTVPTATSDLTNDGDGTSNFATESYVDLNGGKIDVIQVNGTAQTITNKTVNITMPTKVSDLTNDGDGTTGSEFATKAYVDTNGGKIDKIKVNGTEQTIVNKEVDLTVPTKTSDITNDSDFQDSTDVENAINSKISSVYKAKGSIAFSQLPTLTASNEGFVYDINESFETTADFVEGAGKTYPAGTNVVIINVSGSTYKYDVLTGVTDLSNYWTSESNKTNSLVAMTNTEVMAILEPSA